MRVTTKGQVTIPGNVRRHLGIAPGNEVEFELRDGDAVMRRVEPGAGEKDAAVRDLLDHIRRHKQKLDLGGMSVDEFYHMLRD